MKTVLTAVISAASLLALGQSASAQTVREEIHRDHVAVRHAIHHHHRVCTMRHHHRVCTWR